MTSNETENDITTRHRELYWLGRFLFESIEFFGTEMSFNMKVYHGLNKEMMFERFTAHFNQPISTTNFNLQNFAGDRNCIKI